VTVTDFHSHLQRFVGRPARPSRVAVDEVSLPVIRRWVEAIGDSNPIYLDHDAAVAAGRPSIVAPPAMLGVWTAKGYRETLTERQDLKEGVMKALADEGFTTTPGTNLRQEYVRELRLGDRISMSTVLADVSAEKQTALGPGHFVTNVSTYTDQHGGLVGTERMRVLAFRPTPRRDDRQRPRPNAVSAEHSSSHRAPEGVQVGNVEVGHTLPHLDIPIDRLGVAACTTACSDFRAGHYDTDLARAIGTRDVFTDIPTSTGFTARYVTDWAGPGAHLRSVDVRLGVPFFAGDTLHLEGEVTAVAADGCVTIRVDGQTETGPHIIATVEIELPQ
jgi:acyl dehydratase